MSIPVGVARAEVPVPSGTPMAGYAARTGSTADSGGTFAVRALVLDGVALLTVDVCALHERTIAQIRSAVAGQVRACVVLVTHTHSGPCVAFGRLGPHAAGVHDRLVAAAIETIAAAAAEQRPCEVHIGHIPGLGVARNRRHRNDHSDPPVQFLRFDDARGPRAWLVTYPCHPVVLDSSNLSISGDYPAALRARIEAEMPGSFCLFATGAAGDRNPGSHRPDDSLLAAPSSTRTAAEASRIGTLLADAVLAADAPGVAAEAVRVAEVAVSLAVDRIGPEQARGELAAWRAELAAGTAPGRRELLTAWAGWADDLLAGRLEDCAERWTGAVTAVGIGNVRLVTLPGEPFLATAERIAGADDRVLVFGYANGGPGYLLPREEYAHGGYEVVDAHRYYQMPGPFAAGSAEQVEAAAAAALAGLRR